MSVMIKIKIVLFYCVLMKRTFTNTDCIRCKILKQGLYYFTRLCYICKAI